jgi:branched-chain amino acid transport system ATP-binding protein
MATQQAQTQETPLVVDDITKRFGGLTAVNSLSFEVNENEILGFIGPNGAGKTTVFNCIMGDYELTSGDVYFGGENITGWDTHDIVNSGLSRVSQESNPLEDMTVRKNIRMFTLPNSVLAFRGGGSDEEIREIAAQVGLEERLDMYPDALPHADRRRLEIAKAIATNPEMLLLDEPFAGLNQAEIETLSEQIRSFRDEGKTIIVVDHNMKGLMALVDRVIVINDGQLLMAGTPDEVAEDERVQQAYLAGDIEGEI